MKPKVIYFNNHFFASKTEAKYACCISEGLFQKYEYENGVYQLRNGRYYNPDFYLPELCYETTKLECGLYIEVKGANKYSDLQSSERIKISLFEEAKFPIAVFGRFPYPTLPDYTEPSYNPVLHFSSCLKTEHATCPSFFTVSASGKFVIKPINKMTEDELRIMNDAIYLANSWVYEEVLDPAIIETVTMRKYGQLCNNNKGYN